MIGKLAHAGGLDSGKTVACGRSLLLRASQRVPARGRAGRAHKKCEVVTVLVLKPLASPQPARNHLPYHLTCTRDVVLSGCPFPPGRLLWIAWDCVGLREIVGVCLGTITITEVRRFAWIGSTHSGPHSVPPARPPSHSLSLPLFTHSLSSRAPSPAGTAAVFGDPIALCWVGSISDQLNRRIGRRDL